MRRARRRAAGPSRNGWWAWITSKSSACASRSLRREYGTASADSGDVVSGIEGERTTPARVSSAAVHPRAEYPRLVAGAVEASSERLDRDRDASAEWQIVVREERDPHEQKSVRPC